MWLFDEFLPEFIVLLKKAKDKANDPIIFYLFLVFLGNVYLFTMTETSYVYGLALVAVYLLIVFSYKYLNKVLDSGNKFGASPIITPSVLQSYYQVIPIKYRNIWNPTQLVCDLSKNTKLYINFGNLGKEAYISINDRVIKTLPLSHLRIIFLGVIFQQNFIDAKKTQWAVNIRIWGVLMPRIIVTIKPKNQLK